MVGLDSASISFLLFPPALALALSLSHLAYSSDHSPALQSTLDNPSSPFPPRPLARRAVKASSASTPPLSPLPSLTCPHPLSRHDGRSLLVPYRQALVRTRSVLPLSLAPCLPSVSTGNRDISQSGAAGTKDDSSRPCPSALPCAPLAYSSADDLSGSPPPCAPFPLPPLPTPFSTKRRLSPSFTEKKALPPPAQDPRPPSCSSRAGATPPSPSSTSASSKWPETMRRSTRNFPSLGVTSPPSTTATPSSDSRRRRTG